MNVFSEITKVLQLYFDTLYYCDLDKFDLVFHQRAIYATADESPPLFRNMNEYREIIAKRKPPASTGEPRKDYIDRIDLAGNNMERVRARCSIGTHDFIDFLTLIFNNGQWKVIAKVFQIIEQNKE